MSAVESNSKSLTYLTCTFDRAHTLHRVYESLLGQSVHDFEWLIVDDGSTDDTEAVVRRWIPTSPFEIRYVKKTNGGKHSAWNVAQEFVRTPYVAIFDSDDRCLPESTEAFLDEWRRIERSGRQSEFVAVVVHCRFEDGRLVGSRFPQERLESDHVTMTLRSGLRGDKWECFRTSAWKEFRFPDELDVRVVPESYLLNRMAQRYRSMYVDRALRTYCDDGVDTSLVRVSDPRKNSAGQAFVHQAFLNDFKTLASRYPTYFALVVVKWIRCSLYLNRRFTWLWKGLDSRVLRIVLVVTYLPVKALVAMERMTLGNGSGRFRWMQS